MYHLEEKTRVQMAVVCFSPELWKPEGRGRRFSRKKKKKRTINSESYTQSKISLRMKGNFQTFSDENNSEYIASRSTWRRTAMKSAGCLHSGRDTVIASQHGVPLPHLLPVGSSRPKVRMYPDSSPDSTINRMKMTFKEFLKYQ